MNLCNIFQQIYISNSGGSTGIVGAKNGAEPFVKGKKVAGFGNGEEKTVGLDGNAPKATTQNSSNDCAAPDLTRHRNTYTSKVIVMQGELVLVSHATNKTQHNLLVVHVRRRAPARNDLRYGHGHCLERPPLGLRLEHLPIKRSTKSVLGASL